MKKTRTSIVKSHVEKVKLERGGGSVRFANAQREMEGNTFDNNILKTEKIGMKKIMY